MPSSSAPRDIHIEPRRNLGIVRFRIDGVLHQVHQIPMAVLNAMTSRIKILGRMDVIEKRRPQDGRIKTRTQRARRWSCACRRCRPPSARSW
jgi:type II secretory ATPase GspE/PulE/Tfp pilus assembly ATPase PilB-like protein